MTDATQTIRCGSCGHENPADSEVCAACGASLAAYRSISAAVPEARQPAASNPRQDTVPMPTRIEATTQPEPAPARPASPIGDALARIRERTEEERAEQPSVAAAMDEDAGASAITFTPSAEQAGTPSVASAPREVTAPSVTPSPPPIEQPPQMAAPPQPRQTSNRSSGRRDAGTPPKRVERRRDEPVPVLKPRRRQGPDRLARASAASLITWGVVLVALAFVLGLAHPGERYPGLGEAIITIATLAGIVLFIVGLARKSGSRRPGNRRPPRRRR